MNNFHISEEEKKELIKIHKTVKEKRLADKIKAILLLGDGYSFKSCEEIIHLDDRTLRRYKSIYIEKGIEGLLENKYKGRSPKLTEEQSKELTSHLEQNLYPNSETISAYIKEKYNVELTHDGLVITLHRLGFNYKKIKKLSTKLPNEYENMQDNGTPFKKTNKMVTLYAWIKS